MEMIEGGEETVTATVTVLFRGGRGRGRGRERAAATGGGADLARANDAAIEAGTIDDATIDATIGAIAIEAETGNAIEAAMGVAIGAADVGELVADEIL